MAGYQANINNNYETIKSLLPGADFLLNHSISRTDQFQVSIIRTSYCQKILVDLCLSQDSEGKCTQCFQGYFITTSGQCQRVPDQPIPNCGTY